MFAAITKTDTAIAALIRRGLQEVGQTEDTELTAFTDGCSGLRSILVKAGVTEPPALTGSTSPCACSMPGRQPAPCRPIRRSGRMPGP